VWIDTGLSVPAILRVHIATEIKPSFEAKQNECAVYFVRIHLMKLPVHRIDYVWELYLARVSYRMGY
jgi:hypothetical protein